MFENKIITIAGGGYVGFSLAVLLSQKHSVIVLDVDSNKVDMINNKVSPIKEPTIDEFLKTKDLDLKATTDKKFAYSNADLVIVATPTNYNEETNYFDTSSIDDVIENLILVENDCPVFIKSTVPIGFTKSIRNKFNKKNIYFSPEFLREGKSLYDNLHPSRIIVGGKDENCQLFADLLKEASLEDTPIVLTFSDEAESIKLFANTYLAMRVAYFNELDNFAINNGLNAEDIVKGISYDPRIGDYYNNPSFGYSGYCLPKDSKQLKANFDRSNTPGPVVEATIESNKIRKEFIVKDILSHLILDNGPTVGIYRLIMKADSDNFRESAVFDIIEMLKGSGVNVIIYEPATKAYEINGCKVFKDFKSFTDNSNLVVTNRVTEELETYKGLIYTRDIFGVN